MDLLGVQLVVGLILLVAGSFVPQGRALAKLPMEKQGSMFVSMAWTTATLVVLWGAPVGAPVMGFVLNAVLVTTVFLRGRVRKLEFLPPIRRLGERRDLVMLSLTANYQQFNSTSQASWLDELVSPSKGTSKLPKLALRVRVALYVETTKLAALLAVAKVLVLPPPGLPSSLEMTFVERLLGQVGLACVVNTCILLMSEVCFRIRLAQRLAGPAPRSAEIQDARDCIQRATEGGVLARWPRVVAWLVGIVVVSTLGVLAQFYVLSDWGWFGPSASTHGAVTVQNEGPEIRARVTVTDAATETVVAEETRRLPHGEGFQTKLLTPGRYHVAVDRVDGEVTSEAHRETVEVRPGLTFLVIVR